MDDEGRSTGLFVDCPARVIYDVAKSQSQVLKLAAMQPTLDTYIFAGPPGPKDVIRQYTELTGRMELPPCGLWVINKAVTAITRKHACGRSPPK